MIHFYKDDIKNLPTILIKNCARKCHEKNHRKYFSVEKVVTSTDPEGG